MVFLLKEQAPSIPLHLSYAVGVVKHTLLRATDSDQWPDTAMNKTDTSPFGTFDRTLDTGVENARPCPPLFPQPLSVVFCLLGKAIKEALPCALSSSALSSRDPLHSFIGPARAPISPNSLPLFHCTRLKQISEEPAPITENSHRLPLSPIHVGGRGFLSFSIEGGALSFIYNGR